MDPLLEDASSHLANNRGHAPVDSAFTAGITPDEATFLTQPFDVAGHVLRSVGSRVRLLSSLQPLEAGPNLERDFTSGKVKNPHFTYTDRSADIASFREALKPLQHAVIDCADPTIGNVLNRWLQEKINERLIEIDILAGRGNLVPGEGSPTLELSKLLYGIPAATLVERCERQLQNTPAKPAEAMDPTGDFSPSEVRRLIEARYMIPWFNGTELPAWSVQINPNTSVSRCFNAPEERTFFIGNRIYSPQYVEQLIRHEMLHVYRAVLGLRQSGVIMQELLSCGLAGYEMAEEGLAIVSETSCNPDKEFRKQTLFARVITADSALQTLSFRQAYERLRDLNLSASNAYNVVLGTYRGGGFIKDALYLQGAILIQELLKSGEDMTPLFLGKTGLAQMADAQFLMRRGLLAAPTVIPHDFAFFFESEANTNIQ